MISQSRDWVALPSFSGHPCSSRKFKLSTAYDTNIPRYAVRTSATKEEIGTMSTSWENTRKHARALEARLETKLTSYSKLAAQISSGSPRPSSDKLSEQEEGIGGYKLMEEEIEELLEKVRH